MKKSLFPFSMLSLLMAGACSMNPSVPKDEFLIEGRLSNIPDSVVFSLMVEDGPVLKDIAKDTLINGEFSFRDTITTGVRNVLLMARSEGFPGTWLNLWVSPGRLVKISGSDKLLKTWVVESDQPEQQEENRFLQAICPEELEHMRLQAEENDIFRAIFEEHAGDEAYARANRLKIDSLRKLTKPLQDVIAKKELAYLKDAPMSPIWLNKYRMHATRLLFDKESFDIPQIKSLYSRLSEADKQTELGQEITEYMNLDTEVNVGDDMVDGDLYDLDGNLRHLAEFKGQYILLDFWSRGCGPCVQSIPEMEEVIEMYKGKLAVVSISSDTKKSWQEFIAEKKMTGNQWNELRKGRTGLAARYKAFGIPHYVLISPAGKVQSTWSGYGTGTLKAKLKEELN